MITAWNKYYFLTELSWAAQTLALVKLDICLHMQMNFVSLLMKLIFSSQIPFQRCNYSEPCLSSSLPETSNSFAKSVLSLTFTSGGFGLSLLSHSKFSRDFSWKVALVLPQGQFCWKCVLCTTWKSLIFEESSPTQLPLRLHHLVMNQSEAQTSLPHSEQFRTIYHFQSCSGLKLGAGCIICTCPETIIDKHLPDTA